MTPRETAIRDHGRAQGEAFRGGPIARSALRQRWDRAALTAGLILAAAAVSSAQSAGAPTQASVAPVPEPWSVQAGVEERFRFEDWNNLADHSDAAADRRVQWRFRTRVWAAGRLWPGVAFGVVLDNESKGQGEPRAPLTLDETVFESLWLTLTPHQRVSIKVGRQDLSKADGFIWRDGTPGDGARTDYVNAIDASVAVAPKATVELIAASDPVYDTYLPVIHDQHRRLIEWDEHLAGLYYTDRRRQGLELDAYYFFKREAHDTRAQSHPQFQPDRDINTIGIHLRQSAGSAWSVGGDLAAQFGTQAPDTPLRAWAGALLVQRRLTAPWAPVLRAGYTALSGDSPATAAAESWDPLVSRWPMFSDALVLTLGPEVGNAYWTNLGLLKAEAAVSPTARTGVRATYYRLSAFHPFRGSPAVFGTGTNRGDLFQTRLDVTLNARLRGYVLYEHLSPGDFYSQRAPGHFFRVEVTASWQHEWR
jgi:hypothetical protein